MGQKIQQESYRNALNAAIAQREQIVAEFERLKNRRILVETAARALEPVVYPAEYQNESSEQQVTSVFEMSQPAPLPEKPHEQRSVQAVTQVYVRGDGEADDEIQRRINIAIGRSAAD